MKLIKKNKSLSIITIISIFYIFNPNNIKADPINADNKTSFEEVSSMPDNYPNNNKKLQDLVFYDGKNRFNFSCSNISVNLDEITLALRAATALVPEQIIQKYLLNPIYLTTGIDPAKPGTIIKFFYKSMAYMVCIGKSGYSGALSSAFKAVESEAAKMADKKQQELKIQNDKQLITGSSASSNVETNNNEIKTTPSTADLSLDESLDVINEVIADCMITAMDHFSDLANGKMTLQKLLKLQEQDTTKEACAMQNEEEKKKKNEKSPDIGFLTSWNNMTKSLSENEIPLLEGLGIKTKPNGEVLLDHKLLVEQLTNIEDTINISTNDTFTYDKNIENIPRDIMVNLNFFVNCFFIEDLNNPDLIYKDTEILKKCRDEYSFYYNGANIVLNEEPKTLSEKDMSIKELIESDKLLEEKDEEN
jgi:hypothetical protein